MFLRPLTTCTHRLVYNSLYWVYYCQIHWAAKVYKVDVLLALYSRLLRFDIRYQKQSEIFFFKKLGKVVSTTFGKVLVTHYSLNNICFWQTNSKRLEMICKIVQKKSDLNYFYSSFIETNNFRVRLRCFYHIPKS